MGSHFQSICSCKSYGILSGYLRTLHRKSFDQGRLLTDFFFIQSKQNFHWCCAFFSLQGCLICLSEEIEKLDMEDISLGPHYCFGVSCTLNYLLKYYQLSSELPRASKSKGIFFGGCTLIHSFMCLWSTVFYLMYMLPVSAVKIQRKPLSGEKAASVLKWVINFQYLNINLHN